MKLLRKIAGIYANFGSKGLREAFKNKLSGRKALHGIAPQNFAQFGYECPFSSPSKNVPNLEDLRKMVQSKEIKVVSFDIFDTLLVRPTIWPTDIFHLVAAKVDKELNVDFIKLREKAEQGLGDRNATIKDIYRWISKEYEIPESLCNRLMDEEIRAESELLFRREKLYSIYLCALKAGKRIVATSDMYLPKEVLANILIDKGYDNLSRVYVSNEFKRRKDDGTLFDVLIQEEKCQPHEILHIGDNHHSDYKVPLQKGIIAYYYPSVIDSVFSETTLWRQAYLNIKKENPFVRLMVGYCIGRYEDRISDVPQIFKDCYTLGLLGLGPVILTAMIKVLGNSEIQGRYSKIHFASRDGFIPQKVYECVKSIFEQPLESDYFQAGRVLYHPAVRDSFDKFIFPELHDSSLTVGDFIENYIHDEEIKKDILEIFNPGELVVISSEKKEWKRVLLKAKSQIERYIAISKGNLLKYYSSVFRGEGSALVFDCGYSGSISDAITGILRQIRVDKIYLWETEKNKTLDAKNGTNTYCLIGNLNCGRYHALHLIFEELMSPAILRAKEVNNCGDPIFVSEKCSPEMLRDLSEAQKGMLDFAEDFVKYFKKYGKAFEEMDIAPLLNTIEYALYFSPYCETSLLKNIKFNDSAIGVNSSLAKKVERSFKYPIGVGGTGLLNANNYLKDLEVYPIVDQNLSEIKVGLHLHLFNPELVWEMVSYLNNLPKQTDVFVTTSNRKDVRFYESVFGQCCNGFINKPTVIFFENKGRDVAPWLIGLKGIQDKYDLFCHVHGKQSKQNGTQGELWRRYLFDNLLSNKAISEIMSIFAKQPDIGCVFPAPYGYIYNIWRNCGMEVIGDNEKLMEKLAERMYGRPREILRSDLLFSVGTMFWYRPKAFESLFNAGLTIEDFEREPIPLDGTHAHAIERMIKIACEADGYSAKIWTSVQRDKTIGYLHSI